jgi:hypothetical protein
MRDVLPCPAATAASPPPDTPPRAGGASPGDLADLLDRATDAALSAMPRRPWRAWASARRALEQSVAATLRERGGPDLARRYLALRATHPDPAAT